MSLWECISNSFHSHPYSFVLITLWSFICSLWQKNCYICFFSSATRFTSIMRPSVHFCVIRFILLWPLHQTQNHWVCDTHSSLVVVHGKILESHVLYIVENWLLSFLCISAEMDFRSWIRLKIQTDSLSSWRSSLGRWENVSGRSSDISFSLIVSSFNHCISFIIWIL